MPSVTDATSASCRCRRSAARDTRQKEIGNVLVAVPLASSASVDLPTLDADPQRHDPDDERCARHRRGRGPRARRPDRIVGAEPRRSARPTVIDARGGYLLPGFVQTHVHLCQTLFRGLRRRHAAARVAAHARLAARSGAHARDAARVGASRAPPSCC